MATPGTKRPPSPTTTTTTIAAIAATPTNDDAAAAAAASVPRLKKLKLTTKASASEPAAAAATPRPATPSAASATSASTTPGSAAAAAAAKFQSPAVPNSLKAFFANLLRNVLMFRDAATGSRTLAEAFMSLPDPKVVPEYYERIEKPIAFDKIVRKVDGSRYNNLDTFKREINLIFSNNMQFYPANSQLHQDATELKRLFDGLVLSSAHEIPAPTARSQKRSKHELDAAGNAAGLNTGIFGSIGNVFTPAYTAAPVPSFIPHELPRETHQTPTPALVPTPKPAQSSAPGSTIETTPTHSTKKNTIPPDHAQIFDAIAKGDLQRAESLVANIRSSINQLFPITLFGSKFTWGVIHAASHNGHTKIVELLMENGANVELEDTWYRGRPLAWAAFSGHLELCKILVERYNANKAATNRYGQTAFDLIGDNQAEKEWVMLLADEETKRNFKPSAPKAAATPVGAGTTKGSRSSPARGGSNTGTPSSGAAAAATKGDTKPAKTSLLTVKLQAPSVVAAAAAAAQAAQDAAAAASATSGTPNPAGVGASIGVDIRDGTPASSSDKVVIKVQPNEALQRKPSGVSNGIHGSIGSIGLQTPMHPSQIKQMTPVQLQQLQQMQMQMQGSQGRMMASGRAMTPLQMQQFQQMQMAALGGAGGMMTPEMLAMVTPGGSISGSGRQKGSTTRGARAAQMMSAAAAMNAMSQMTALVPDNQYAIYLNQLRTHASQLVPNIASPSSSHQHQHPLFPPQRALVASIGVVANDDNFRMVIPFSSTDPDTGYCGHAVTLTPNVVSVNIRVVLVPTPFDVMKSGDGAGSPSTSIIRYSCTGFHSYTTLTATAPSTSVSSSSSSSGSSNLNTLANTVFHTRQAYDALHFQIPGATPQTLNPVTNNTVNPQGKTGDIQDCSAPIRDGVNAFEIVIVATLLGPSPAAGGGNESLVVLDEVYQTVLLTVNRP